MAKCLGAKTVAAQALACTQELEILSEVVEDREAVNAVQRFLGERALSPSPPFFRRRRQRPGHGRWKGQAQEGVLS